MASLRLMPIAKCRDRDADAALALHDERTELADYASPTTRSSRLS